MVLFYGFIEGSVVYTDAGEQKLLALPRITEATFNYTGELSTSETFSLINGVKSPSSAALVMNNATFTLSTSDLSWSMMQASLGIKDQARTANIPVSYTRPVTGTTITIPTAAVGDVIAVDTESGEVLEVSGVTGTTVTLAVAQTGNQVTVRYMRATSSERSLEIGTGARLGETGVYGRFVSETERYLVVANRTVIQPSLELGVGGNLATATTTLQCLTDANGVLASIIQLPSSTPQ